MLERDHTGLHSALIQNQLLGAVEFTWADDYLFEANNPQLVDAVEVGEA